MLAQVCERLPGADADVVTSAIGCDTRIGSKYLKGALGYGGPCFPRDNVAFSALARATGAPALLAEATDQLNRRQVPRLTEIVRSRLPKGGTVGVLGLSYKPDTEVIESWFTIRRRWKTPSGSSAALSPMPHPRRNARAKRMCW
jgi:UDPglucose 6-dehydrogenase